MKKRFKYTVEQACLLHKMPRAEKEETKRLWREGFRTVQRMEAADAKVAKARARAKRLPVMAFVG